MPTPSPDTDLLTPADAARILGLSVDMVRILAAKRQLPTAAKTARGARLFRRSDVEDLAATRAGRSVRHHSVQFYETDEHLVGVVAAFLHDALRGGAAAIAIATEAHRAAFVRRLEESGAAPETAIHAGKLILLDARETLDTFATGDALDPDRFRARIGGLIEDARRSSPRGRPRAFGEMVDLLWRDGRHEQALALEDLWNRLSERHAFSLLCGYAIANFPAGTDAERFDRICGGHTRVVPTESFRQDGGIDCRHREIARLQQRARALESEVAQRARTEKELRRAKQALDGYSADLAEALRAKEEILAILGHELRNPLAPIASAIELLRARGAHSREHEIIDQHVRHLHRIIGDLIEVGRLVRGKVELKRSPVEVARVVARAIELSTDALAERRQDLALRVPSKGLAVDADLERLAQAVANLIRNALQHSAPGSQIEVAAQADEATARITVTDGGEGIPPDLLRRVFDLFVQRPQPLDRPGGGFGIGLAITKNLVELHGGAVEAHSEGAGKGSRFIVTLPRRVQSRADAPSSPPSRPGSQKLGTTRRILVVDDNEDAACLLAELLTECGHETRVAHHADAAEAIAASFDPQIALLDIGLPVVDGYELARRLRARHPSMRLVAISGYGASGNRARSVEAGFEAHLVKPVLIGDVLQLLEGP